MPEATSAVTVTRPLSASQLAAFCLQVSILLRSGIPLHDGVAMLAEDVPETRVRKALKTVGELLADNRPLHDAIEKAAVFPPYLVRMVRIGTESGRLDDVAASLSDYYEREDALGQTIRSAVIYPLALILMMLAVMMLLAAKVLPVFEQVFSSVGASMSPAASAFMHFGLAAGRFSFLILIIVALLLGAAFFLSRTDAARRLQARASSFGRLAEEISTARFASSMALMLASGLDTERALRMACDIVTNDRVRRKLERCIQSVECNGSFIDALAAAGIFPAITSRMLSLGFRAGTLDAVMKKVADDLENDVESSLARRVALIEPISVAILSAMIGLILLSVMLPLMSVMSSIG